MREKRGLTQRQLAHDLGISQNYIPAIESGARRAGPKLQEQMVKYFGCRFDELFEVVQSGAVKIRIGQRYRLADAAQAQRELEARNTTGSSVLIP